MKPSNVNPSDPLQVEVGADGTWKLARPARKQPRDMRGTPLSAVHDSIARAISAHPHVTFQAVNVPRCVCSDPECKTRKLATSGIACRDTFERNGDTVRITSDYVSADTCEPCAVPSDFPAPPAPFQVHVMEFLQMQAERVALALVSELFDRQGGPDTSSGLPS